MSTDCVDVSIIFPCLNEEMTLGKCIRAVLSVLREHGFSGEVLVADNGSEDRSRAIALEEGARVVDVPRKGYGNALRAGMRAARGRWIAYLDADMSYDANDLPRILEGLRNGADLVIGSRFRGTIDPGAMPWLHQALGTPLMSALANLLFRCKVSDINSGMWGFTRETVEWLDLQSEGMELCSEMIIKASRGRLRVDEVPISLHVDQRGRRPHLRTFRDGWRNLQVMMHYCSILLFLLPGLFFTGAGAALTFYALDPAVLFLAYPAALFCTALGVQILLFAFTTQGRVKGSKYAHKRAGRTFWFLSHFMRLENGLVLGGLIALAGLWGLASSSFAAFHAAALHVADPGAIPLPVAAATRSVWGTILFVSGFQTFFTSLFVGLFGIRVDDDRPPTREEIEATRTKTRS